MRLKEKNQLFVLFLSLTRLIRLINLTIKISDVSLQDGVSVHTEPKGGAAAAEERGLTGRSGHGVHFNAERLKIKREGRLN